MSINVFIIVRLLSYMYRRFYSRLNFIRHNCSRSTWRHESGVSASSASSATSHARNVSVLYLVSGPNLLRNITLHELHEDYLQILLLFLVLYRY